MGDVLIPELRAGECTNRICVRASRLYDVNDETKLLHADLVLIDEEVHVMFCMSTANQGSLVAL
jgi:replication factor A1